MKNEWELPPGYSLRLAGQNDDEFLMSLFCSARPELTLLPLPPEQLTLLLRHQYSMQQHGYVNQYPHAENWLIATYSGLVGKIMFERTPSRLHIIDFIIAPDWRGRGVGGTILSVLKTYVDANAGALSLRVDRQNVQGKKFYYRHGFVLNELSETHELLVWSPVNESTTT